jgi:hypothetical protein
VPKAASLLKENMIMFVFVFTSGFADLKEQWLERYENEDFPGVIQKVWTEEQTFAGNSKLIHITLCPCIRLKLLT